jgi:hypothetical protein
MTLKNEIFEGLGAATAAKKLVYDPRDDYYDAIAEAARMENERRKREQGIITGNRAREQQPGGPANTGAPAAAGVPTSASLKTPQAPTIPGVPVPGSPPGSPPGPPPGPTAQTGWGTSYPPGLIEPPGLFGSRAQRGGRIKAIRTNYRHGGPVLPYDDGDDEEMPDFGSPPIPMPRLPRFERAPNRGQGTPRNPRLPPSYRPGASKRDPGWLQGPYSVDDEELGDLSDPGQRTPFDARLRRYDRGGTVDDEQNERDQLVQLLLQNTGQINRMVGEPWTVPGAASEWHGEGTDERARQLATDRALRTGPPLPVDTPPPTAPPPVRPPSRGPVPTMLQPTGVRPSPSQPVPVPPAVRGTEFGGQEGIPPVATSSRFGRAVAPLMQGDPNVVRRMELEEKIDNLRPGLFEQTTPGELERRKAEIATLQSEIDNLSKAPIGAGVGVGPGDTQTAARATGPTGTTQPPAPPVGGTAANRPTTAPKSGATAMRPDLPNWNPLGMDLRATAGPGGGGGGGGGGAGPATPPARLPMSDPNRVAAYDPSNPEDVNDPTRRRTNEELAQVLVGATTQMPLSANGRLPVVGQGAVSRHVGQAYVARYDQGGRWEPGEAILRGMLSDYKSYLQLGRLEDANKMAAGLIQYANLEAASHAHVAEAAVKAGNFYDALRNVVAAASYLPDGMSHQVGADGRSINTIDPRTGQVTANTPVDGRWLLAAIGGFKNGDLLWHTLAAAAQSLQKTDKNAEGRALSNMIRRNTLKLQGQRLAKGAAGKAGPPGLTETEKRLAQIAANLSGSAPPGTEAAAQPTAQGDNTSDEVNPPLDPED